MKVIAHRANLYGPNKGSENSPSQILRALDAGFEVEVDIYVVDSKIFLGHDYPQYDINYKLLSSIANRAWFHCKNLEALEMFVKDFSQYNFFWHQDDDFALTSSGYIWTYPGKKISNKSILVLPELTVPESMSKDLLKNRLSVIPHAICTDWPYKYVN